MSEPNKDLKDKNEVDSKSVQQKLTDLSELVTWFQNPAFKLEEAVAKYQEAEALAEEIEKDLIKLKNEIKVVKKRFDGE